MNRKSRFIVYDTENEINIPSKQDGDIFFPANPPIHSCTGCLGCWGKTPGKCIIKDKGQIIPKLLLQNDEFWLISPILYGGYSQNVKAILDRSTGYISPFFNIIHKDMHHKRRYSHKIKLVSCFYGKCSNSEKEIAKKLVKANAINLGITDYTVLFFNDANQAIKEVLK